jgi:hypothetical protein
MDSVECNLGISWQTPVEEDELKMRNQSSFLLVGNYKSRA